MIKSAAEYEKEFLENIVDKTGKTLKDWKKTVKTSKLLKTRKLQNY